VLKNEPSQELKERSIFKKLHIEELYFAVIIGVMCSHIIRTTFLARYNPFISLSILCAVIHKLEWIADDKILPTFLSYLIYN